MSRPVIEAVTSENQGSNVTACQFELGDSQLLAQIAQ